MYKILIVDDEEDIVDMLTCYFETQGYLPIKAYSGEEAIKKLNMDPDLILLDIMMPGKNGYDICLQIRDKVNCPIIFLTAKVNSQDIIKGLNLGADDYLLKPFTLKELSARVGAHLRREKRRIHTKKNMIYYKNMMIDLSAGEVRVKENLINLTKTEFEIIAFLASNQGQIFSKEQLYERIWGYDEEGDSRTLTEHIKNIRKKIAEVDGEQYITTVWGIGYKWEQD